MSIGGPWLLDDKQWHINALELKTIFLDLKSFIKEDKTHIMVFSESITAIACINKIGISHLDICHRFSKLIWKWTERKGIYPIAAQIHGVKNIGADRECKELSVELILYS